jgi:hypothetical protein
MRFAPLHRIPDEPCLAIRHTCLAKVHGQPIWRRKRSGQRCLRASHAREQRSASRRRGPKLNTHVHTTLESHTLRGGRLSTHIYLCIFCFFAGGKRSRQQRSKLPSWFSPRLRGSLSLECSETDEKVGSAVPGKNSPDTRHTEAFFLQFLGPRQGGAIPTPKGLITRQTSR